MNTGPYDLIVIGAGSGGVRAARVAASLGARVAVVEAGAFGGTCVNVGCVPKKLLVHASEFPGHAHAATFYGFEEAKPAFDWSSLIANKDREIERLNGIYERLLKNAGAEIVRGLGRFVDPHTIAVGERELEGRHVLIATGGAPYRLHVPGSDLGLISDDVFHLPSLPRSVVIAGGGYIAVEFAMMFNGLGVETHLVFRKERVLRGFDETIRAAITEELVHRGVNLHADAEIEEFTRLGDDFAVISRDHVVRGELLVHATGRRALVEPLDLDRAGVELDPSGFIRVDAELRTSCPHIFAAGDVVGHLALTPIALAEGTFVAKRLFGEGATPVDYEMVPTAVFSSPTIATVGLTEAQARARHGEVRIFETSFRPLRLTLTDSPERTTMKLVVDAATDRVVGCHMLGEHAAEIVQGLAVAMKAGATKETFDATIGIHPTSAEEFVTMRAPVR